MQTFNARNDREFKNKTLLSLSLINYIKLRKNNLQPGKTAHRCMISKFQEKDPPKIG